ncbi:hypothetical protein BHE74_00055449 [Ensete ventricosum]|uniref:Uncharacterized protein n=1 Tax=Ensete ventricosum TaxID=4639 RepID=A0A426Z431_ENSVE|nr:hypothetical protein B296_00046378 [Ensete ventricosum]RWV83596.1 hypothetical protein GW17_00054771 [Ensete ventricosum]RWW39240.1 hypothetical protein BHE74_00055449 [Ensete ventricosum]
MDKVLMDLRPEVVFSGRAYTKPVMNRICGLRFPRQSCSHGERGSFSHLLMLSFWAPFLLDFHGFVALSRFLAMVNESHVTRIYGKKGVWLKVPLGRSELVPIAVKWMPLNEFVEQPLIQDDKMFRKIIDICIARLGKRYCGLAAHQVISKFDGRSSSLYYNVVEPQDFNCQGV